MYTGEEEKNITRLCVKSYNVLILICFFFFLHASSAQKVPFNLPIVTSIYFYFFSRKIDVRRRMGKGVPLPQSSSSSLDYTQSKQTEFLIGEKQDTLAVWLSRVFLLSLPGSALHRFGATYSLHFKRVFRGYRYPDGVLAEGAGQSESNMSAKWVWKMEFCEGQECALVTMVQQRRNVWSL